MRVAFEVSVDGDQLEMRCIGITCGGRGRNRSKFNDLSDGHFKDSKHRELMSITIHVLSVCPAP